MKANTSLFLFHEIFEAVILESAVTLIFCKKGKNVKSQPDKTNIFLFIFLNNEERCS